MALRILEMILSNLPMVLILWSALSLSWGLYIMVSFQNMIRFAEAHNIECHAHDRYNVYFMVASNAVLATFLVLEPILAPTIGDAIVVLNTFYSVYLVPTTVSIAQWWRTKTKLELAPVDETNDHLLT